MPKSEAGPLLRFIRAFRVPGSGPEDAALLERYVRQRDEAAFELLMWRHAAMVLHVCQDTLQDTFEAEDAFQATFLVLARKAASISKGQALAGWLYRVALRIALKARHKKAKRTIHEQATPEGLAEHPGPEPTEETIPFEWRPVLHEEIARLPPKYQTPTVLCYLEGRTHEQAALELGWAKGTVAGRLARARDLLRRRLTRRGLVLSTGLALASFAAPAAAAVPAALVKSTCRSALAFAAGKTAGLSPQIALWAEGAMRTMLWINLKPVILVLGALTLLGAGTGAVIYGVAATDGPPSDRPLAASGGPGAKPSGARPPAAEPPAGKKKSKNTVVVCRHEGMIDVVGTEIKPGEKAEPDRMVQVRVGTERRNFKTLQEGDRVKAGQLLLRLDDRLARNKLKIALAKLALAKTDLEGATKVFEEAVVRYQGAKKLFDRNPPLISREEYGEKKLARDRFQTEVEGKKAQILVAEAEAANAEIILDMHEVRSPVNGFVAVIYRRPGEGVKALDPVIEIMPEQKEP